MSLSYSSYIFTCVTGSFRIKTSQWLWTKQDVEKIFSLCLSLFLTIQALSHFSAIHGLAEGADYHCLGLLSNMSLWDRSQGAYDHNSVCQGTATASYTGSMEKKVLRLCTFEVNWSLFSYVETGIVVTDKYSLKSLQMTSFLTSFSFLCFTSLWILCFAQGQSDSYELCLMAFNIQMLLISHRSNSIVSLQYRVSVKNSLDIQRFLQFICEKLILWTSNNQPK